MTRPPDPESEFTQAAFERNLFESAHSDAPPSGATERAWHRFATDAATLASLGSAGTAPRGWIHGAAARSVKWTLIGAVGGAGLVALWLRPTILLEPTAVSVVASLPIPVAGTPADSAVTKPAVPPAAEESTPRAGSAPPVLAADRTPRPRRISAPPVHSRSSKEPRADLLLAREVAALDAARTALAVGAHASALHQIEQYHRDFPGGELSADADVVAIEALAAQGDAVATQRAARLFLEQHSHDPHVERVRELVRASKL